MKKRSTQLFAAVLAASSVFAAASASAQKPTPLAGTFPTNRFDPAPVGDRFVSVNGGTVQGEELLRGGITFDYAAAPLVIRSTPAPIIENQLVLHTDVSLALWERLLLSGSLPIVLVNEGNRVVVPGAPARTLSAPDGPSIGDLELGFRIHLAGIQQGYAEFSVGGNMWLPTGHPADFTGDAYLRGMPYLSMSGARDRLIYASHLGVFIQHEQDFVDVHLGPELHWGAAAAFVFSDGHLELGPELTTTIPLSRGAPGTEALFGAELLGSARMDFGDLIVGGAFGPGLFHAVGTPSYRALVTVAYAPIREKDSDGDGVIDRFDACPHVPGPRNEDPELNGCPSDRDEDGILDRDDACPDEPGIASKDPRRNGCPVPTDRDGDGIPDKLDACPDQPGPANVDRNKNGCPPDRDGDGISDAEDACPDTPGVDNVDPRKKGCPADADGDGIPDAKDACPDVPGSPDPDPAKNGCPRDTDGDGIPDHLDACPLERGVANVDPKKNGCPIAVRFTSEAIELYEPLPFAASSSRVPAAAEPALREIASVLADHPEVLKLGLEAAPGLESWRAAAVARWLVDHGVAQRRLEVRPTTTASVLRLRILGRRAAPK